MCQAGLPPGCHQGQWWLVELRLSAVFSFPPGFMGLLAFLGWLRGQLPLPEEPLPGSSEAEMKRHKREKRRVLKVNAERHSLRSDMEIKLQVGDLCCISSSDCSRPTTSLPREHLPDSMSNTCSCCPHAYPPLLRVLGLSVRCGQHQLSKSLGC